MRCLVTGGAGLVGSEIVDLLLMQGFEVTSVDNYSVGKKDNLNIARNFSKFREIELDIRDLDSLSSELNRGYDIIFHEAVSKNTICLVDPVSDLDVNAKATLQLLILAKKYGVSKFIHASTGSVYGRAPIFPTHENSPKAPVSFYGISKLAAENYVKIYSEIYGLEYVILRYFHVFGHRQDSSSTGGVIPIFITRAMQDKPILITGDGTQVRAFTHVSDVARINLLCALDARAKNSILNCASDSRVSILELANLVKKSLPTSKSRIDFLAERIGDIKHFDIDNSKLTNELGFRFEMEFVKGIEQTILAMRN
jgi:UDP-glucose 4-epimerase